MSRSIPQPWTLPADDVLRACDSRPEGLTTAEADERLRSCGPNALHEPPPVSAWTVLVAQLRSVVVLLLAAATLISLLVGDLLDASAIAAVLLLNTLLGFTTELRARRAMHALLRLEVTHAHVLRGGALHVIDASRLVPGDVIELEPGHAVPADARILTAAELRAVEAALTGESAPVDKSPDTLAPETILPERRNMLFAGTHAVAGSARAVVVATGMSTELGRIGTLVGGIAEERTPLEQRLDALGRRLALLALLAGALVIALGVIQGVPLAQIVTTGIALAIAAVPEGLRAVATITLAVGVHRMARRHALVRRLPAVETLGSVTVVCSDKTGTLTAGEMTVTTLATAHSEIRVTGSGYDPVGEFRCGDAVCDDDPVLRAALRIGMLANRASVARTDGSWAVRGDPTEGALLVAAMKAGMRREACLAALPETGQLPFSSETMLMATFHRSEGDTVVALKGAPDRVLDRCTLVATGTGDVAMSDETRTALLSRNLELAGRGLRVLGLADGSVRGTAVSDLRDLRFVAFACLADPPAQDVDCTIAQLGAAGIRTVMITGDQQRTAQAVATSLGILAPGHVVVGGAELDVLDDAELAERLPYIGAYSRVTPEQKLHIVTALQRRGDIVAMLGDGVNDAAALKKADVGVCMGRRGTDVARQVAAVVLQDDRFATVADAVEEGRVIFDNIRKFVFYLFSCNLAEVLVLLGAGLLGLPVPLTPLQILWLNLVTDTFPALALAMEPGEKDVMHRPPRDPERAILSRPFMRAVSFYGALLAATTLAAYALALYRGLGVPAAMTIGFTTLALAQALHLGNARSTRHVLHYRVAFLNRFALGAVLLVVLLQLAAVYVPALAAVLGTVRLTAADWLTIVPLAAVTAVVGQAQDLRRTRRRT